MQLLTNLDYPIIKRVAIFALIYNLLFNSAVIIYKFDYYKVNAIRAYLELTKDFIYIYITLFIIFFGISINRIFFAVITIILFISGGITSYYLYFFKIVPTQETMIGIFNSNIHEIHEFIGIKLILWLLINVIIVIYMIRYLGFTNFQSRFAKIISISCLLLSIHAVISPKYKVLSNYFPIQYLHNTYVCLIQNFSKSEQLNISNEFNFIDNSDDNIVAVLVIGESARYDHFGINGYERDTTPLLQSTKNLLSFRANACANMTYLSVSCMLSRHPANDIKHHLNETTLLSVFTRLGFNTTWLGTQSLRKVFNNQNLGTIYDEANFSIIPGGSALMQMNDYDGLLLPYVKSVLTNNTGKQLLVIHTSGSHWHYGSRYPKEFAKFTPDNDHSTGKVDQSCCDYEVLINSYDNSILYTDYFLHQITTLLKNKNAFLIYAADHGESLGEKGRYGHGGEMIIEHLQIPFFVWFSDKFKQNNPGPVEALEAYKNFDISHDHIFHSIFDCIGIASDIIDPNLSLCKTKKHIHQNEN